MEVLLFSKFADESAVLKTILQQAAFIVRPTKGIETAIETWPERPADMILIAQDLTNLNIVSQIKQMRMYTVIPICVITDPIPENYHVELLDG